LTFAENYLKVKDMTIYKLEIPIPDYDKDNIFMQPLYFEGEHEPSKEEVLDLLWELDDNSRHSTDYDGLWMDCLLSIDSVNEFPDLQNPFIKCETTNALLGFMMLSVVNPYQLYNS
jgi:hypothetical protein